MRLADFIEENREAILVEWDHFAATLPGASGLDAKSLRDHAGQMLVAIVADMREVQRKGGRDAKSHGALDTESSESSAALTHGTVRELQGIDVIGLFAEFRALRSAVCRLWSAQQEPQKHALDDLVRFDEALDMALAESLSRFQERLLRRRSLMLGTLAHDLRNPLAALLLTAQAMRARSKGEASVPALDRIIRNAQRAERIVRDLFDMLLAIGSSGLALSAEEADLVVICGEIIDEAQTLHPDAQISFSGPSVLRGSWDVGRLSRLLSNLVENAVRHGEGTPVEVRLGDENGMAVLTVTNGGTPIPEEYLRRIFESLTQGAPSAHSSHSSGAGLGLYIARKIADSHGGSLTVDSTTEHGTVFTLRLPRQTGEERLIEM